MAKLDWPARDMPSTTTTLFSSSMPEEAEAVDEYSDMSRMTVSSLSCVGVTSPKASATPKAEAARE